ncbi:hypothetical protein HHK36_015418 [Tetracentron sinense]|uniref:Flavin-containing monooxygenase n=1 Tax=Tetracentron sinense TaxID=13715 RepID=A0A834Z652_TETSI|nr:hypothetical protein HHK36_015418 [Tetracentron sinense]
MVCEKNHPKFVCVIGAGPSGLVAARELRKEGHSVIVMEQNHDIGGQWLYDPRVENEDPLGKGTTLKVHGSIYASLRLTSPREIMGFTDFPFLVKKGRDMRRFPGHEELLLYLKDFSEWFGLREMIRFNTRVEYVGMVDYGTFFKDMKWVVRSKDKKSEKVIEEVFDAVVVATGHYSQPRLPSIKGMDAWRRKQMHSHIYRVPEPFRNEVVVVVGNSLSGQDISMELVGVAKEIHLSSKSLEVSEGLSKIISKYENLHIHPQLWKIMSLQNDEMQIDSLREDGRVLFMDGSWVIADTIIYCTGYSYSFPYLDTKGIVVVDDDRVGPLYEHTFPPSLAPSLSFVGIPRKLIGFPFFESQAKWIAQLLSGKRTLPSWDDMMQSIKEFYHSRDIAGIPKHNTHDIANFEYCDKYGDQIGFPRLEKWRKELCLSALRNSDADLETYRDSWDDLEQLQIARQSPHFTEFGPEAFSIRELDNSILSQMGLKLSKQGPGKVGKMGGAPWPESTDQLADQKLCTFVTWSLSSRVYRDECSLEIDNLCAEESYAPSHFHGCVEMFPFDDNHIQPFQMIKLFCESVLCTGYLEIHGKLQLYIACMGESFTTFNILAGNGRTGLMVCAHLVYRGMPAEEALELYGHRRTAKLLIMKESKYQANVIMWGTGLKYFLVYADGQGEMLMDLLIHLKHISGQLYVNPWKLLGVAAEILNKDIREPTAHGDVRVIFYQKIIGVRLSYACFNTAFVRTILLQFSMPNLDKIGYNGKSIRGAAFCLELLFNPANAKYSLSPTLDDDF